MPKWAAAARSTRHSGGWPKEPSTGYSSPLHPRTWPASLSAAVTPAQAHSLDALLLWTTSEMAIMQSALSLAPVVAHVSKRASAQRP